MRKIRTLLIASFVCLMFGSCGNNVDSLLDDYEQVVDEYVESLKEESGDSGMLSAVSTMGKSVKYLQKVQDISDKLDKVKGEMTSEQQDRMVNITLKLTETSFDGALKGMKGIGSSLSEAEDLLDDDSEDLFDEE